jgi:hypothetical protein
MEEAPENGKESSHSAHASRMNEPLHIYYMASFKGDDFEEYILRSMLTF